MEREGAFDYVRPKTRAECEPGGWNAARPCPFVSCTAHILLDVNDETGSLKLNRSLEDLLEGRMAHSCALDAAMNGGATLEEIGQSFNITRERIRQIEGKALGNLETKQGRVLQGLVGEAVEAPLDPWRDW